MLRDSTVVAVVRAREQYPLAMMTMRKSIHGFPLLSMGMGLRLAAFGRRNSPINSWVSFSFLYGYGAPLVRKLVNANPGS